MLLLVFAAFLFFEIKVIFALQGCPPQLPRDRFLTYRNGVCYRFYIHKYRDFWDAEKECERDGGTLVVIGDQQTNNYLYDTLYSFRPSQISYHPVWIGLTDANHDGKFEWIDGSVLTYEKLGWQQGSTHFHPENGENCVVIQSGDWENRKCKGGNVKPFICQYHAKPLNSQKPTTNASTTKTTTKALTTPVPTCPPFICDKTCGMDGFVTDEKGCSICECDL